MNLLSANKLNSVSDVWQRGVLRLVWCFVGWLIAFAVCLTFQIERINQVIFWVLIGVVLVPLIGVVFDLCRLWIKRL